MKKILQMVFLFVFALNALILPSFVFAQDKPTATKEQCKSDPVIYNPIEYPECVEAQKPQNLPRKLGDIGGIISTAVGAAILIAAILAFLYLIWGGIQWITSGGDKGALEEARGRITAAIVGLVIVGAAWGIFKIIESIFGFQSILGG